MSNAALVPTYSFSDSDGSGWRGYNYEQDAWMCASPRNYDSHEAHCPEYRGPDARLGEEDYDAEVDATTPERIKRRRRDAP